MYPTPKQTSILIRTLLICKDLYNRALEQRITLYRDEKKSVFYEDQTKYLTLHKNDDEKEVYTQVLQNALKRLETTFQRFFKWCKTKEGPKVGFPRFKSDKRYRSFTYPQEGGFKLSDNQEKVKLSHIGTIKVVSTRKIIGKIKTCQIIRDVDQWYVNFTVEEPKPIKPIVHKNPGSEVGIDLGIKNLCALTTGEMIENPRFYRKSQKKLAKEQRKLSRKILGSHNRQKQRVKVARLHRKIRFQRDDYIHKISRRLVNAFETIVFEDLRISNMVKNRRLSKHILDSSWYKLTQYTSYKAESAGGKVILVNPRNTSQLCSNCNKIVLKTLAERTHLCPFCGYKEDRDINASKNILKRSRNNTVGHTEINNNAYGDSTSTHIDTKLCEQVGSLK